MADDTTIEDQDLDEEIPEEEKTPESEDNQDEKPETKDRRSAIAQKKHWRERALKAEEKASTVEKLQNDLSELRSLVKKPTDEQEAKAQEYIRAQARSVFEELQKAKDGAEKKELDDFEKEVEEVLEANPDFSEEELLDAIEEYEVSPKTAIKILQRQESKKDGKPRMPKSHKADPAPSKELPDDSKKSMFDILREETARLK